MESFYTFSRNEKAVLAARQLSQSGYKVSEPKIVNGVWQIRAVPNYTPPKERREKARLERLELAPQDRLGVFFLRNRRRA